MTTSQILGTAATLYGFGASFAMLLQVRQLRERGTSCDVSAAFLSAYVGGYAIWLLYSSRTRRTSGRRWALLGRCSSPRTSYSSPCGSWPSRRP